MIHFYLQFNLGFTNCEDAYHCNSHFLENERRLTYYVCILKRFKERAFLEREVKITLQYQFKFKLGPSAVLVRFLIYNI